MSKERNPGGFNLLPVSFLRSRRNAKWKRFADDILPAWVAEMDFTIAPPIQAAVEKIAGEEDYGYPLDAATHGLLAEAFAKRMAERFGWQVDPALVQPTTDLVQSCFATIMAFSEPGDGIVLQTPSYPPFRELILGTGRRLVANPLRDEGHRYGLALDHMRSVVDERTRMILFCHPQNPTGRVYDEAELRAVGQLAIERDLVIVCDEIHADLVYSGRRHIPLAKLDPEIAARTVTITSATKSFNIPGLRCGLAYFGSEDLKSRFHRRIPNHLLGQPGLPGFDGTIAAWTQGQPWLDRAIEHLETARDHLAKRMAADFPGGAFLCAGSDLSRLDRFHRTEAEPNPFRFFLNEAKVGLSAGDTFDPDCAQFVRLNFATSIEILDQILDRMSAAIRRAKG